jgi:hypothetical protein
MTASISSRGFLRSSVKFTSSLNSGAFDTKDTTNFLSLSFAARDLPDALDVNS